MNPDKIKNLIPAIIELLKKADHKIGWAYVEYSEDGCGWCCDAEENYLDYEEDGWEINITYECSGDRNGDFWHGEVTAIRACRYDEESDEVKVFTRADCAELIRAVNEYLA